MIEPNIEDTSVLRRTLESIENRLLHVVTPVSLIETVDTSVALQADGTELNIKLNEMIEAINTISSILNSTRKNQF